jgi:hypothetical protein
MITQEPSDVESGWEKRLRIETGKSLKEQGKRRATEAAEPNPSAATARPRRAWYVRSSVVSVGACSLIPPLWTHHVYIVYNSAICNSIALRFPPQKVQRQIIAVSHTHKYTVKISADPSRNLALFRVNKKWVESACLREINERKNTFFRKFSCPIEKYFCDVRRNINFLLRSSKKCKSYNLNLKKSLDIQVSPLVNYLPKKLCLAYNINLKLHLMGINLESSPVAKAIQTEVKELKKVIREAWHTMRGIKMNLLTPQVN